MCLIVIGVLHLRLKIKLSDSCKTSDMGEGEPWMLLVMFGHTYYPLLIVNLLIYSIIIICAKECEIVYLGRWLSFVELRNSV